MKKFGVVTISHRREQILRLFCASIQRLRKNSGVDFPCVCVGDPGHDEICSQYNIHHIYQANHPAAMKWNTGVEYLMGLGVDYVIIMGSDDIMSDELLHNLRLAMDEDFDIIGIRAIWFYACDGGFKGQLRRLDGTQIFGVGRTINMRIIEKAHPMWRNPRSWGMDGDCMTNIRQFLKTKITVPGMCVDVKSQANQLNKMTFWLGKLHERLPEEDFLNILGEEEKQILSEL